MPYLVKFSQFCFRQFLSLYVSSHYGLEMEIASTYIFKGDVPFL